MQVDYAGGSQVIIPMQTNSFEEARARAKKEAEQGNVFDAVVISHSPPYTVLDEPFY